ncbi:polycystic kidney disease protein 1-like 2 [Plakobranchus ocellatus]|uniref:Polycystic kidney disease protein 1-like 2 n=1 Tax=Plakobranchus ocellatus TaxID=259542 RepID=A0AAV3ZNV6_9GAST|nr:polycystic kidney disease protein 1-like 2 [Plakobranchus ocellatus]
MDTRSYGFHAGIIAAVNPNTTVEKISTPDAMYTWAKNHLFPYLYGTQHWNGSKLDRNSKESSRITSTLASFRLGPIRIRQQRVQPEPCKVHQDLRPMNLRCVPSWSSGDIDWANYDPGWTNTPQNFTNTKSLWRDIGGTPVMGRLGIYPVGGYVLDLKGTPQQAKDNLSQLQKSHWVDQWTKVVFIETTIYTPNINMFAMITAIFEFPQAMVIQAEVYTHPFKLFTYMGDYPLSTKIFDFLMYFTIVWFAFIVACRLRELKANYFRKFWNVLELLNLILAIVVVVLYVGRQVVSDQVAKEAVDVEGQFYNFQTLAMWDQLFGILLGFCCCMSTLKVLHLLRFNPRFCLLGATMKRALRELGAFSFLYGLILAAFCCFSFLVFSSSLFEYSTVMGTIQSLLLLALGDLKYEKIASANRVFAPVLITFYMALIVFLLLNVLISILMDSFAIAREAIKDYKDDLRLLNDLKYTVKTALGSRRPWREIWTLACNPHWESPKKPDEEDGGAGGRTTEMKTSASEELNKKSGIIQYNMLKPGDSARRLMRRRISRHVRFMPRTSMHEFPPKSLIATSTSRDVKQLEPIPGKDSKMKLVGECTSGKEYETTSGKIIHSPDEPLQNVSRKTKKAFTSRLNLEHMSKSILKHKSNMKKCYSPRPWQQDKSISTPKFSYNSMSGFSLKYIQESAPRHERELTSMHVKGSALGTILEEDFDCFSHRLDLIDRRLDRLWWALVGTEFGSPPELDTICRWREVKVTVADVVADHFGTPDDSDISYDSEIDDIAGNIVTLNDSDLSCYSDEENDKNIERSPHSVIVGNANKENVIDDMVTLEDDKNKLSYGKEIDLHRKDTMYSYIALDVGDENVQEETIKKNEIILEDRTSASSNRRLAENIDEKDNETQCSDFDKTNGANKYSVNIDFPQNSDKIIAFDKQRSENTSTVYPIDVGVAAENYHDGQIFIGSSINAEASETEDDITENENCTDHRVPVRDTYISGHNGHSSKITDQVVPVVKEDASKITEKLVRRDESVEKPIFMKHTEAIPVGEKIRNAAVESEDNEAILKIKAPENFEKDEKHKDASGIYEPVVFHDVPFHIHTIKNTDDKNKALVLDSANKPSMDNQKVNTNLDLLRDVSIDINEDHADEGLAENQGLSINDEEPRDTDNTNTIVHKLQPIQHEKMVRFSPLSSLTMTENERNNLKTSRNQSSQNSSDEIKPEALILKAIEKPRVDATNIGNNIIPKPLDKCFAHYKEGVRPFRGIRSSSNDVDKLDVLAEPDFSKGMVPFTEAKPSIGVHFHDYLNDSGYQSAKDRDFESPTPAQTMPILIVHPNSDPDLDKSKSDLEDDPELNIPTLPLPSKNLNISGPCFAGSKLSPGHQSLKPILLPRLDIVDEMGMDSSSTEAKTPRTLTSPLKLSTNSFSRPSIDSFFTSTSANIPLKNLKKDSFKRSVGALAVARKLSKAKLHRSQAYTGDNQTEL